MIYVMKKHKRILTIKTHDTKEARKAVNEVIEGLYHLEDLTSYKNKRITTMIDNFQNVEIIFD